MSQREADPEFLSDPAVLEHLDKLREPGELSAEGYLAAVFDSCPPDDELGRSAILLAAVAFLTPNKRSTPGDCNTASFSQSQRGPSAPQVSSTLTDAVAAMIDPDALPSRTLLLATDASARAAILPVLLKLLQGLARRGPVQQLNGSSSIVDRTHLKDSQDTVLDEELCPPDGNGQFMSGPEMVEAFVMACINRKKGPCGINRKGGGVFATSLLREVPVSDNILLKALKVILTRLSSDRGLLELDEAPSLIYNLLLLTSNNSASRKIAAEMKRSVIFSIIFYFRRLDQLVQDAEEGQGQEDDEEVICTVAEARPSALKLRQVQGTVLLYFDFAARQDPALSAEIIKLAKTELGSPLTILTSFGCAILLVMARSSSCFVKVIEGLTSCIHKYRHEMMRRSRNRFSRSLSHAFPTPASPEESVLRAIEASGNGWDYIAEPALSFALAFLDEEAKMLVLADPAVVQRSILSVSAILESLFKQHASLRGELVEQLLSRIVLNETSAELSITIVHNLARKRTLLFVEQARRIKENLDDLISLPAHVAAQLMFALAPVFESRPDLQDYCFIALRKALVRREVGPRTVAALGFLEILIQATDGTGDAAFEASSFLRRTLSHQAVVKKAFYSYLRRQISDKRIHRVAAQSLLGILHPYLARFVSNTDAPYLFIERCLSPGNNDISEDLAELILVVNALEGILCKRGDDPSTLPIALKLAEVSLERFDVDKESDFKHCVKDRHLALVLEDSLKAFSCVIFENLPSLSEERTMETLVPLLHKRQQLLDALKDSGISESAFDVKFSRSKSKGRPTKISASDKNQKENIAPSDGRVEALFELSSTCYINDPSPLEKLVQALSFISQKYVSLSENTLLLSTSILSDLRKGLGRKAPIRKKDEFFLQHVATLLPDVMALFRRARSAAKSTKQTTACMQLALEVVEVCFTAAWQRTPTEATTFGTLCLALMDRRNEDLSAEEAGNAAASALENLCSSLIEDGATKEAVASLKCLERIRSFASSCASAGSKNLENFLLRRAEWAKELILTCDVKESAVLKEISGSALEEYDSEIARPLDCSIYKTLGDQAEEDPSHWEPICSAQLTAVSKESIQVVLPALSKAMESALDDGEWALKQVARLYDAETTDFGAAGERSVYGAMATDTEALACALIEQVVLSLSRLCRACFQKWAHVESVLKVVSRVYKLLSSTIRYQLARRTQLEKALESLVEKTGNHLTPGIYTLMTFAGDPKNFEETKQKIVKESRLMPGLICHLEEYEILLLKLSKQPGQFKVSLVKGMKRSTARDFRIDLKALERYDSDNEGGSQASNRKRLKGKA